MLKIGRTSIIIHASNWWSRPLFIQIVTFMDHKAFIRRGAVIWIHKLCRTHIVVSLNYLPTICETCRARSRVSCSVDVSMNVGFVVLACCSDQLRVLARRSERGKTWARADIQIWLLNWASVHHLLLHARCLWYFVSTSPICAVITILWILLVYGIFSATSPKLTTAILMLN